MKRKTQEDRKVVDNLSKLFKKLEVYTATDLIKEVKLITISCSYSKKKETGLRF